MATKKKSGAGDDASGSFEAGVEALEGLVAELESGELPLEKALESFERGVRLVRRLNERLNQAENKIEILSRGPGGDLVVEPHEPEEAHDPPGSLDEDDGGE